MTQPIPEWLSRHIVTGPGCWGWQGPVFKRYGGSGGDRAYVKANGPGHYRCPSNVGTGLRTDTSRHERPPCLRQPDVREPRPSAPRHASTEQPRSAAERSTTARRQATASRCLTHCTPRRLPCARRVSPCLGAAMTKPLTLPEIDAALIAVHWRWLHSIWQGDKMGEALADCQQNALLEQRYELTCASR